MNVMNDKNSAALCACCLLPVACCLLPVACCLLLAAGPGHASGAVAGRSGRRGEV
jgi:hypothetical protein